jgi:hypothetical protein
MRKVVDYPAATIIQSRSKFSYLAVSKSKDLQSQVSDLGVSLGDVARQLPGDSIDYINIPVSADTNLSLAHGFSGAVRFYMIDYVPATNGTNSVTIERRVSSGVDQSTTDTLELVVQFTGSGSCTIAIRVEAA